MKNNGQLPVIDSDLEKYLKKGMILSTDTKLTVADHQVMGQLFQKQTKKSK